MLGVCPALRLITLREVVVVSIFASLQAAIISSLLKEALAWGSSDMDDRWDVMVKSVIERLPRWMVPDKGLQKDSRRDND